MNYHNPEQLAEWGQSDGWRLLTTEEIKQPLPDDAEYRDMDDSTWVSSDYRNRVTPLPDNIGTTYRTKKPLPASPLIAQLDAEIKVLEEKKAVALAVEAGAEWEVKLVNGFQDWHKGDYEFDWYVSGLNGNWQVRLKPKPVTRPWSIADVPWNCRLRGKEKVHEGYWFVPFTADLTGITILSGGKPTHQTWKDLEAFWNYTTPELNGEWKPCETTEEAK